MRTPALLVIVLLSFAAAGSAQPVSDPEAIPDCGPGCGGGDEFSDQRFQEQIHGGMERIQQEKLDKRKDEARQLLEAYDAVLRVERIHALLVITKKDKMYRVDQYSSIREDELEKEPVGGSKYKAGQLLDPSFAERAKHLATARESLDRLHGLDATRDREDAEKRVKWMDRALLLGHLEGERYRMKQSLEDLTSESMNKALATPEVEPGVRERLKAERDRLVERLRDLSVQVSRQDTSPKIEVGLAAKVGQAVGDAKVFESFRLLSNAELKPENRPVFKEFSRDLSLGDYQGAWKRLQN